MKTKQLLAILFLFIGLNLFAQAPLQYQLKQQGGGNCAGSPVELSVTTTVRQTTAEATEVAISSAVSGGNIANDGGNTVTQRGVCWNTSSNPTTANFSTSDGAGLGNFISNLSGLNSNTTYYVRAYAINTSGTFYGNEVSFTTNNEANPTAHSCGAENVHNPNLNYGTMTDQDGNIYKTIVIGNQEWMAENLKASHYRNGDLIPIITDNSLWGGLTTGAACWNNNDSITYDCPYGKLYNYYAVADSRNVCPTGWHIPNDAGWSIIINYLDPNADGGNNDNIASGKMRSTGTQYWFDTNQDASNETGFSALPGGSRTDNGNFSNAFNYGTVYWSSTEYYEGAWARDFYHANGRAYRNAYVKRFGLSVRCLKDSSPQQGSINSIDCGSSLTSGILTQGSAAGDLTSSVPYTDGNGGTYPDQTITSTGVTGLTATCAAGTFANGAGTLTYIISGTPESSGTASFALNIGGQSCSLQIPVNAPQIGTPHSCGAENVHNPNLSYGSMTDQEGNVYKTIVIGNQEWMAENLKASHYSNGDLIPNITDSSEWIGLTTGAWVHFVNDNQYECPYGKLYNWYVASESRNVCPTNWHVASDSDFNNLIGFTDPFYSLLPADLDESISEYVYQSDSVNEYLSSSSYSLNSKNKFGFSIISSKFRNFLGDFSELYDYNSFGSPIIWTSNNANATSAWARIFYSENGRVYKNRLIKKSGFSIRCVKDQIIERSGEINALLCDQYTSDGLLISGQEISGFNFSIPYIGSNGGKYSEQTIESLESNLVIAKLDSGILSPAYGSLTYSISGYPVNTDTISFSINLTNKACIVKLPLNINIENVGVSYHSSGTPNIHNESKLYGGMTDQDGQQYRTIKIGNQVWMAEDLKVNHFRNGDLIPNVSDSTWSNLTNSACFNYDNNVQFESPFGKLYNWYSVTDPRELCPTSWHIPTNEEWDSLITFIDPQSNANEFIQSYIAGNSLKSINGRFCPNPSQTATNESGFSALSSGSRLNSNGFYNNDFAFIGIYGTWWSSSEENENSAWRRTIRSYNGEVLKFTDVKSFGYSVRCIKD
jgi:uncharacterized protein (TIGR02145 family)